MKPSRKHRGFTLVEALICLAILGILLSLTQHFTLKIREETRLNQARADISIIESKINLFNSTNGRYPDSLAEIGVHMLDPWGYPYQYTNVATEMGKGNLRKDRNLIPINSDYDLFSMGPDGRSAGPLTAPQSQDDVIRANNGGYIGLASGY